MAHFKRNVSIVFSTRQVTSSSAKPFLDSEMIWRLLDLQSSVGHSFKWGIPSLFYSISR